MLDDFFCKKTLFRVIILNQDNREYEKYRANFDNNNNKKELEHMLKMAEIKNIGFFNSYIYIDVNKARQNLYIKLFLAINNLLTTAMVIDNIS